MSVNKTPPAEQNDAWLRLRCSERLLRAVEKHVSRNGGTLSGFVREAVAERLLIEGPQPRQRERAAHLEV
jgi:hypothetical protein